MKVLGTFIVFLVLLTDPTKIGKINALKSEAKKAYEAGDFKTAISKYRYLIDSLQVNEDEVKLNLANAYFQLNDTANAVNQYQSITQSTKNKLRSKAQQQLGVMTNRQGKFEEALNHFKQAIKSDPTNEDARYNYELLKKKLEEQKKQEQQKQDQNKDQNKDQQDQQKEDQKKEQQEKKDQEKKDQEKKDQEKKDQQQKDQEQKDNEQKKEQEQEKQEQEQKDQENKDQEKKEKPNFNPEKMKQMKLSEEKAKMILEAMRNQEKQYLQQNKRKATKAKDKGKPDW